MGGDAIDFDITRTDHKFAFARASFTQNKKIIQGSRGRLPERRGKTRRYAAIFDEKGLPLPSATGVMIGGPRSSMLADGEEEEESETGPIVVTHAVVASGKSTGIGAALRRGISSAARSVLTCCPS